MQADKLDWLVNFPLELASLRWRDGIQAHFMPWKGVESVIDQKFYQRDRCCPFHVHGMVGGRAVAIGKLEGAAAASCCQRWTGEFTEM